MRRLHRPASHVEWRGYETVDAEPAQTQDATHRIDDGIHGTHLVEVHLFDGDSVGRRLHLAEPSKEGCRTLLDVPIQRGLLEQLKDVVEAAVVVVVVPRGAGVAGLAIV
jgi:hypothetical protein